MNESYNRKTVIITGSSRGIGAATAEYFASKNYNVVINYVTNEERANELKNKLISTYNIDAIAVQADVSKEEDCLRLLEETKKHFDTIDCLVNNAGIAIDTTLEDKTVDNFRKILDTNLIGVFLMCKHVGTHMKDTQGFGSIVNISSTNGIDSFYPYSMDYDASKAGVISLTHNFANLYSPTIRVNCIAPGWVNTEMNKQLPQELIEEETEKIYLTKAENQFKEIAKNILNENLDIQAI